MDNLLRKDIDARSLPLGATPAGSDWCIKALHPSDPLTEVRGIPDRSAVPSVLMNYQTTFTLKPSAGATGTWSFEAAMLPHPINFCWMQTNSVVGGAVTLAEYNVLNAQMDGISHLDKYKNWVKQAERWRLAYMSVSIYQDGADLANQGTVVVCQPPVGATHRANLVTFGGPPAIGYYLPDTVQYSADDVPNFDVSQGMPNAYFNRSKDGAYVPLKLTETCQDWLSECNEVSVGSPVTNPIWNPLTGNYGPIPAAPYTGWPHLVRGAWMTGTQLSGDVTSDMGNGTWAHISAKNLAVSTNYAFFFRCGWELQVRPGSVLAPQMKLSPAYDAVALDTYFAISREFKDAYPVCYNDLGEIWDVISKAAKTVLPYIRMAGPLANAMGGAAQGIVAGGDIIRGRRKAKRAAARATQQQVQPSSARTVVTPSATEVERAKSVIAAKRNNRPQRKR